MDERTPVHTTPACYEYGAVTQNEVIRVSTTINIGCIHSNSPNQNAGWFIGQFNIGGWNADQKINSGQGGISGIWVYNAYNVNNNFDGFEVNDGNILYKNFDAPSSKGD